MTISYRIISHNTGTNDSEIRMRLGYRIPDETRIQKSCVYLLSGLQLFGPFSQVIPAELCTIPPGQLYKKKLSQDQTKRMVTFATKRPQERLDFIKGGAGDSGPGGTHQAPVCPLKLFEAGY